MAKHHDIAEAIRAEAQERGVRVSASGTTVTARVTFPAGDRTAYVNAESDCYAVLGLAPRTSPGSIWGTDSGSVGGHVGLTGGYCTLHKSGVGKLVVKALSA